MRAERFTMVGHHRNHGFVIKAVLAQRVQQFADAGVGVGDFSVVELGSEALLVGRRRVVGIVRVVKMDPEEEWSIGNLAEPSQGVLDHDFGAPLHRFVAVSAVAAQVKARVIDVEAPVKSGSRAIQRIENQRSHKRAGVVSTLMQQVRQIRQLGGKRHAKIIDVIELRVSAGKNCGM